MSYLEKDVIEYSIILMLKMSETDKSYNFLQELLKLKESIVFKSSNIGDIELNNIINKYIISLNLKGVHEIYF